MEEVRVCRICFESTEPLISPCRCSGSLKCIHEECLKSWLVSKRMIEDIHKCEICHSNFELEYKTLKTCSPLKALSYNMSHCVFVPLLLSVKFLLLVLIFILYKNLILHHFSDEMILCSKFLIGICSICVVVLFVLIVNELKQACIVQRVSDLIIHTQNFDQDIEVIPV